MHYNETRNRTVKARIAIRSVDARRSLRASANDGRVAAGRDAPHDRVALVGKHKIAERIDAAAHGRSQTRVRAGVWQVLEGGIVARGMQ